MNELVADYQKGVCILRRKIGQRPNDQGLKGLVIDFGIYEPVCRVPMTRKQFTIVERRTLDRFERRMRQFPMRSFSAPVHSLYDFFLDRQREEKKAMTHD